MDVWTIRIVDYDTSISGIYSTPEKALEAVRSPYGPPYIVRWEDPEQEDADTWSITGHFKHVKGYSGEGPTRWIVERWPVDPPSR